MAVRVFFSDDGVKRMKQSIIHAIAAVILTRLLLLPFTMVEVQFVSKSNATLKVIDEMGLMGLYHTETEKINQVKGDEKDKDLYDPAKSLDWDLHHWIFVDANKPSMPATPKSLKTKVSESKNACPRILIGIMSMGTPEKARKRNLLRMMYSQMMDSPIPLNSKTLTRCDKAQKGLKVKDIITIKFIVGAATAESRYPLELELSQYHDLIVLKHKENMNDGKTYDYFKTMGDMGNLTESKRYEYIAKADDDAFLHLPNVVRTVWDVQHRVDIGEFTPAIYLGRVYSGHEDVNYLKFITGQFYLLSWPLVDYIRTDLYVKSAAVGPEDFRVAVWVAASGMNFTMVDQDAYEPYKLPSKFVDREPFEYTSDLVCIHPCKEDKKLLAAMEHYFPLKSA